MTLSAALTAPTVNIETETLRAIADKRCPKPRRLIRLLQLARAIEFPLELVIVILNLPIVQALPVSLQTHT
jgi:hypothetical protein